MSRKQAPEKTDSPRARRSADARSWWIPLALLVVLVAFTIVSFVISQRQSTSSGARPSRPRTPADMSTATPGAPIAEIRPMFIAGPGALIDEFRLALICVTERYPFPDINLTQSYLRANVSQTLKRDEDYIVLFFAPETGQKVKAEEWLRIRDAVLDVCDEQVFGIIESHSGELTLFKKPKEISRELERLRESIPATDPRKLSGSAGGG